MRLSKIYVAWAAELGSLVIDVGEQTHLEDALAECCSASYRPSGDRSIFLPVKIFHHSKVDIHLVDLITVQTD